MKKYVFGLLSGILFVPIIEEFLGVILQWVQVLKIKPTKIINKWNKECLAEEPTNDPCVIGFEYPNEEYYEDDEDYDE